MIRMFVTEHSNAGVTITNGNWKAVEFQNIPKYSTLQQGSLQPRLYVVVSFNISQCIVILYENTLCIEAMHFNKERVSEMVFPH